MDHFHPRRHLRKAAAAAALFAGLVPIAACGSSDDDASASGDAKEVTVATLKQPHLFAPDFYQQFAPEGVTFKVVTLANSTEIKNAVVSGSADFGVTGITSALQGAAQGEPVRIIASAADGGSAIVAGKDTGITSVAQLKGKKIGYVPGSAQDVLLRLTLKQAGVDAEQDAKLTKIEFADMANALKRGDIDAFSGAETGPSVAIVDSGAKLVTHPYDTPMKKINIVLATSQKKLEAEPELVQDVVDTHVAATDYMASNPDEWGERVVKAYGFPQASLDMALKNIELRSTIDDAYVDQTKVLGQQLKLLKQIRQEPDYEAFFNRTFIDKSGEGK